MDMQLVAVIVLLGVLDLALFVMIWALDRKESPRREGLTETSSAQGFDIEFSYVTVYPQLAISLSHRSSG